MQKKSHSFVISYKLHALSVKVHIKIAYVMYHHVLYTLGISLLNNQQRSLLSHKILQNILFVLN